MRIGILTHHFIANFGAFLQAYALQEAVKKEFPYAEVVIINYIHTKHYVINNCGWFRFYPQREGVGNWLQKIGLPETFFKARHQYLNLTQRCYGSKGVNRLKIDVVIVGSDEVWNFKDSKSDASIKFGNGLICKRLVAYAPSVGNSAADDGVPDYVRNGLKRFDAISVRDSLGQELVERLTGQMPLKVLDPTFLIDFPIEKVRLAKKKYILFYYAEHLSDQIKRQIIDYAYKHGLGVYGAGECDKLYTDVTVNLTPFQWVDMFRNASFVFTGTFHGVVFSIKNRKPFKVYLTQENRKRKVNDLLDSLEIKNRHIEQDFVFNLEEQKNEIDYAKVDRLLTDMKRTSIDYLRRSIVI